MSPKVLRRINRDPGIVVIKRELLEAACYAITANAGIIRSSLIDLGFGDAALEQILQAIKNVLDRDHRSGETRGGS